MELVVLGAGSLGSLLCGLLAREHEVTLVGRDPHVTTVRESGLTIEGACDTVVSLDATTDGTDLQAEAALVTVKAFDTEQAAAQLATGSFELVCSLQNGIGNEETLAAHVDADVVAGTTTYGARLVEPGRVECTGIGEVVLGAPDGGPSASATRLGDAFRSMDVETTVATDMPRRLWKKLAVNAGINATTALATARQESQPGPPREKPHESHGRTASSSRNDPPSRPSRRSPAPPLRTRPRCSRTSRPVVGRKSTRSTEPSPTVLPTTASMHLSTRHWPRC